MFWELVLVAPERPASSQDHLRLSPKRHKQGEVGLVPESR
jgi:hypothetical protein